MFLVLILVYVAIMALRAQRIERELSQLQRDVEAARDDSPSGAERSEPQREQEPVL